MDKDNDQKHDVIDDDLYEELDEEELYELVKEERQKALAKAREEKEPKPKRPFPKWAFWLIAIVMVFNVAALLPRTFSIPAIDFLKTSAQLSTQEDIQAYKEAVVVVETEDGKGTGFAFREDGTILTNHHVIEGEETVTVAFPEQGLFNAEVQETYPSIDLAVLKTEADTSFPHLELANEADDDAEEAVYFIGNPLRFNGIANEGTIVGPIVLDDWEEEVLMLEAPVYRGNSGSPVITPDGKVIGVIFATLNHDDHGRVGLFVPIDLYYERQ